MHLEPLISPKRVNLRDRDARRPAELRDDDDLKDRTEKLTDRLRDLQRAFYADGRRALLVVLQGRDAAGKDGAIRKVFGACNPQGCQVTSFKQPTPLELRHDFLWRVHAAMPPHGMIGLFNRSHYEDVLVVRVNDLVPKRVWSKRYDQINDFERMLTQNGVVILKFFLHVSRDEQRLRLIERLEDPEKNWKFNAGDLDDRARWKEYTAAYTDAIRKCSTKWAPWYVVPADSNRVRDHLVADVVVRTLEKLNPIYPSADPSVLELASTIV